LSKAQEKLLEQVAMLQMECAISGHEAPAPGPVQIGLVLDIPPNPSFPFILWNN